MEKLQKLMALGRKGNVDEGALDRLAARIRRPADRAYEARAGQLRGLAALASAWPEPGLPPRPRVLVAALRGWSTHNACELVIAHALRLRGAEVALMTCGGGMPACEVGWARRAAPRPCDRCGWITDRLAEQSSLPQYALRDHFPWGSDARRAPRLAMEGDGTEDPYVRSQISLMWLLRATRVERLPEGPRAREDFAVAAEGVAPAARTILDRFRPDVVFVLNGLFGAERTIRDVALERGLRVPTYEIAPRANAIVLSQGTPAPYYDTDALWEAHRERPLTEKQRREVVSLLRDRARGVGAHERYFDDPESDSDALRRRLGLSDGRRVVTLFTNLSWDSATVARDVGFGSMFEWIVDVVKLATERPEMVLVVRVHPAERSWGTREAVASEIVNAVGMIPDNVCLVPAEEPVSSYALLELSDLILAYTTTVGLEAAVQGKPVAVAGETHYRGRGFTIDLGGHQDLIELLDRPPAPLDNARVDLALRYAFTFFFRGMVPFGAVRADGGWVRRVPSSARELRPGVDPYLDWICDRILDGADFGLPEELASGESSPSTIGVAEV